MSENRLSSSREPKRQPGTAASRKHTCVPSFASAPAASGRDLDRLNRSALSRSTSLSQMRRDLGLQQRYGMTVGAIRRYARQQPAAGSLPADGSEVRTLTKRSLTAMLATQRFQDTFLRSGTRTAACTTVQQSPRQATEGTRRTRKGGTTAKPRQASPGPGTAREPLTI